MITDNNYLDAWIVYWVGSALLLLVGWRIIRRWPAWLKFPLILIFAAFMLVPFSIQSEAVELAPAWLIMLFEGVFMPDIGFSRVGPTLGVAAGAAVLIFPVVAGVYILVKRLFGASEESEQDDRAASDHS